MPTLDMGAYAVFKGNYLLNAASIDLAYAGKIPTTTNSTSFSWTRIYTSHDKSASINCNGSVTEGQTQENGILNVWINAADKVTINSGVADMSFESYRTLLMINPTYATSSGTGMPLNFNHIGKDLMDYGFPLLVVHKSYQDLSTGGIDTPVLTDPMAFFFTKVGLSDRKYTVPYDPTKQQVVDFTLTAVNVDGTTYTNVGGYFGTLTAATSSTST